LKSGYFKKRELQLYELSNQEIDLVIEYQKKIPILQKENENWIDARILHQQLKVGRDFSTWIKKLLLDLDAEEDKDFSPTRGKSNGGRPILEYSIKVDIAKEIAMVAGAKGGSTNKELKQMSSLVRRYFKIMEKAAKYRVEWNNDRTQTIAMFYGLTEQLKNNEVCLIKYMPTWWQENKNIYSYEMNMINQIVIGMSSKKFKKIHNLKSSDLIRNSFTEVQLEIIHKLEEYSAILIEIQEIYDPKKRQEQLLVYFEKKFKAKLDLMIS